MTWFDVFVQLPYPILRIFGAEDRVRWRTEDPEDLVEPFLHGFLEVRGIRHMSWL